MFNITHIQDLLKGKLSEQGYKHIVGVISFYIKKYNWPKAIIVSGENSNSNFWISDDVKELAHQFFEWILKKGKIDNLNKISDSYLSYYFFQVLISFVSERIKQEQQKQGLSFEKCRELVISISNDDLIIESINGVNYVFNHAFNDLTIKPQSDVDNTLTYLSKIPINNNIKHYKPLVKMAIEDVLNVVESPIPLKKLVEYVYQLFDQKEFDSIHLVREANSIEFNVSPNWKYQSAIKSLFKGLSKNDIKLFSEYLFQSNGEISLSELAFRYDMPKSTLHYKIESFKKKISKTYTPENEEDGILFIQNISSALDDHSK